MMIEQVPFTEVAFTTFQAVVQVIIICLAGFLAARRGVLNKDSQKNVGELNMLIFTPAMIFSMLAPSLSLKKMLEIIIIPAFYAISTAIAYITAIITNRYLGLENAEGNFVKAMSVFGNVNSLPFSLTLTLAATLPNLEWDQVKGDDRTKIASRGLLYLVIFQQIGQVLRWSWGYNKLLKKIVPVSIYTDLETAAIEQQVRDSSSASKKSLTQVIVEPGDAQDAAASTEDVGPTISYTPISPANMSSSLRLRTAWRNFLGAMNAPLWAMFAAVIVASSAELHDAFYVNKGFTQYTLSQAIDQLGDVSIPLILLVLGGNLYPDDETPPASPHYNNIVIGSLVSRMIIPPLILLPMIAVVVKAFPISILTDPIFLIVAFLLTAAPPAIQLSQICQLNEIFEEEMAGVLFWGYVVLTLPTTIGAVASALWVLQWSKSS